VVSTGFHQTDEALVYSIGYPLWWMRLPYDYKYRCMGILWFINSSPEFYFEQQMPLDSKQEGVVFRGFSKNPVQLLSSGREKCPGNISQLMQHAL
jgi:hypothetical protein